MTHLEKGSVVRDSSEGWVQARGGGAGPGVAIGGDAGEVAAGGGVGAAVRVGTQVGVMVENEVYIGVACKNKVEGEEGVYEESGRWGYSCGIELGMKYERECRCECSVVWVA